MLLTSSLQRHCLTSSAAADHPQPGAGRGQPPLRARPDGRRHLRATLGGVRGRATDTTVHIKNGWLPDPDLWDINSIGDFTRHDRDYSIVILTSNDPDMAYGVDTVEAIARRINKALAEGEADAPAAPEPFHHLLYMQRRFLG